MLMRHSTPVEEEVCPSLLVSAAHPCKLNIPAIKGVHTSVCATTHHMANQLYRRPPSYQPYYTLAEHSSHTPVSCSRPCSLLLRPAA